MAVLGFCGCLGFSLVAESRATLYLRCAGVSLWQLLLLRSMNSGGLQQCISQALEHRLSSGGTQPQLLCGKWGLPGTGIEPKSSGLAGRFFTTELPGKPNFCLKSNSIFFSSLFYIPPYSFSYGLYSSKSKSDF